MSFGRQTHDRVPPPDGDDPELFPDPAERNGASGDRGGAERSLAAEGHVRKPN
jgi:hypothetical protein